MSFSPNSFASESGLLMLKAKEIPECTSSEQEHKLKFSLRFCLCQHCTLILGNIRDYRETESRASVGRLKNTNDSLQNGPFFLQTCISKLNLSHIFSNLSLQARNLLQQEIHWVFPNIPQTLIASSPEHHRHGSRQSFQAGRRRFVLDCPSHSSRDHWKLWS